jgi:hypothetical protein
MNPLTLNIYMSQKVLLHEVVIGGRMGRIEANVLIQVKGSNPAEVETVQAMQPSEILIHPARSAPGRQSKYGVRLFE